MEMNQISAAQYWWEHLTRRQQLFLKFISVKYGIENKDSYIGKTIQEYWYEYSLNNDIHKLVGWPETTESRS